MKINFQLANLDLMTIKIIGAYTYQNEYLTGAGESGKSTLVKQMKIIHSDGFTRDELRSFRPTIMDNLLSSMKYVLTGMGLLRINLQSSKNKVNIR